MRSTRTRVTIFCAMKSPGVVRGGCGWLVENSVIVFDGAVCQGLDGFVLLLPGGPFETAVVTFDDNVPGAFLLFFLSDNFDSLSAFRTGIWFRSHL